MVGDGGTALAAVGRSTRWRVALAAILCAGVAGAWAQGDPPVDASRDRATDATATSMPVADLWLPFEDQTVSFGGDTEYPDANGRSHVGRVESANDGTVEVVPGADDRGDAVAFPGACTEAQGCPRAMVEVTSAEDLNPGERDFAYGAAVWLAPDQTTTGSNVVQKGRFATEGGLWKLQVDSAEGQPSCVVRTAEGLVTVRSTVSIADSRWHRVECRRDRTGVSIRVDDTVEGVDGGTGSVDNEWPIRIGSPGVGDHDDQFHGRVDDVFLTIAPAD
ncbi:LamG-like jellyroll fold domain-containing protein [Nocardioides sp. P5_C9_2]